MEELFDTLTRYGERAGILAGGTDLLFLLRERQMRVECLIDIGGIAALRGIAYSPGEGLTIGAATKIRDLERSAVVRERFHGIYQSAGSLGSTQIRTMATLGGNICNASPAADAPPSLIALGASVRLESARGKREMPVEDFIGGTGSTARDPDEVLTGFSVPEPRPRSASRYAYAGLREAMEIDLANVAVSVALEADGEKVAQVRIVMGAVGPTPVRAQRAEQMLLGNIPDDALIGQAAEACAAEAEPIDDARASADYRREVLKPLVRRTLKNALDAIS